VSIQTNEYGETLVFHKGIREPLQVPITGITDTTELMAMVSEYFEELPTVFNSTILMPGILKSENPHATLETVCTVMIQLIDLIKTEPAAVDNVVLAVMYDRYKRSLTMVMGKLRYQLGPDTLISEQVGNA